MNKKPSKSTILHCVLKKKNPGRGYIYPLKKVHASNIVWHQQRYIVGYICIMCIDFHIRWDACFFGQCLE